ncbi:MAG: anti-sigma factor [Gemmatimonadota bacterium]
MTRHEIDSCEEALKVLAEYLDSELRDRAPEVADGLERHLEVCRSCYSRAEFEKRLKARIADGSTAAPDGLRDRMRAMIREFAVATPPEA